MTRGRSVTARVTYFAAKRPDGVIGAEAYARHDPTKLWDDEGIAEANVRDDYAALVDTITQVVKEFRDQQANEMRVYGAAQVQAAVVDYISSSDLELAVHDDQIILSLDASAGDAELRPWWYLEDLLADALKQGGVEVEEVLRRMSRRLMPEIEAAPRRRSLPEPEPEPERDDRRIAPNRGRRRRAVTSS